MTINIFNEEFFPKLYFIPQYFIFTIQLKFIMFIKQKNVNNQYHFKVTSLSNAINDDHAKISENYSLHFWRIFFFSYFLRDWKILKILTITASEIILGDLLRYLIFLRDVATKTNLLLFKRKFASPAIKIKFVEKTNNH